MFFLVSIVAIEKKYVYLSLQFELTKHPMILVVPVHAMSTTLRIRSHPKMMLRRILQISQIKVGVLTIIYLTTEISTTFLKYRNLHEYDM